MKHTIIRLVLFLSGLTTGAFSQGLPPHVSTLHHTVHGQTVGMTSQVVVLDDGCVAFTGEMEAGDFFLDLKRTGKGNHIRYQKHNAVVTEYPAELEVLVRIGGADCYKGTPGVPPASVRDDSGSSFTFNVIWRDGKDSWAAESSLPVMKRARPSSYSLDDTKHSVQILEYRFAVNSKGVPLASRLIVGILRDDGRQLAEISGGP